MHITAGVLNPNDILLQELPYIPVEGTFLEPGQVMVMEANGHPVIIATTGIEMFVAHPENADVIGTIIETFRNRGVPPLCIGMSIQMYLPNQEGAFVDKAIEAGVRHVWAACPVAEFLARMRAPIGRKNLIMLRRDN